MFLFEVMSGQDRLVYDVLSGSTWGTGDAGANKMNAACNYAFSRWPEARYHGPMFRVIRFEVADFMKFKSNEDVLRAIRGYKHDKGRQFFSFAKTVKGVSDFVTISREYGGDDYVPFGKDDIGVLVLIQQTGNAVDLTKVAKKFRKEQHKIPMQGESVGEVLASLQNNSSIKLYHVIGLGEEMSYDWDDEESDEDSDDDAMGTHQEGDYRYRPDQFKQMMQGLEAQHLAGSNDVPDQKKFHKKSPLKRYNGSAWQDYE